MIDLIDKRQSKTHLPTSVFDLSCPQLDILDVVKEISTHNKMELELFHTHKTIIKSTEDNTCRILDSVVPCLLSIINSSFSAGCVPDYFKTDGVLPFLKKPDHSNNRLISQLSFLSKIQEKIV